MFALKIYVDMVIFSHFLYHLRFKIFPKWSEDSVDIYPRFFHQDIVDQIFAFLGLEQIMEHFLYLTKNCTPIRKPSVLLYRKITGVYV